MSQKLSTSCISAPLNAIFICSALHSANISLETALQLHIILLQELVNLCYIIILQNLGKRRKCIHISCTHRAEHFIGPFSYQQIGAWSAYAIKKMGNLPCSTEYIIMCSSKWVQVLYMDLRASPRGTKIYSPAARTWNWSPLISSHKFCHIYQL